MLPKFLFSITISYFICKKYSNSCYFILSTPNNNFKAFYKAFLRRKERQAFCKKYSGEMAEWSKAAPC